MVALSRKFHSRPVFISVCSEIFVVTGRKTIRLDEAAEKGKLREPCIKAGAFRKAFVLDVR